MKRKRRDERFKVVIAGGGVAALEAALALDALAEGRVDVELVAPEPRFWYRPAAVGEPFGLAAVKSYDLADLAGRFHASFNLGALERSIPTRASLAPKRGRRSRSTRCSSRAAPYPSLS